MFGLCLAPLFAAAEFNPFEGPMPIAIFIQSDPWDMVIGSDTPRVAVYENGEVILVKKINDRPVYHRVMLDKDALARLSEQLKPVLAMKDLKSGYEIAPNVTDQPQAMFYFRDGTREITTAVYGLRAADTKLPAYTRNPDSPVTDVPPAELLKLHKWLCELDYPKSEEWTPKYVEVMLWDYSYAPDPSIQWPKPWPALNSYRAMKRGNSYSIFLDGSILPKLRKFLATQKKRGAIQIDGKKMAASYRSTFPGEPFWHRAFAAAKKAGNNDGS